MEEERAANAGRIQDDGAAEAEADAMVEDDPKSFVLARELAEVHLLLDNLSSDPDVTLSALAAKEPLPKGLDDTWLDDFCRIHWPPAGSSDDKARQASLLIRIKDYLNRLAKPASGLTIAFTIFVTQSATKTAGGPRPRKPGIDMEETRSRLEFATIAYPDLVGEADKFRVMLKAIRATLVGWLIFTCVFSWYVAYGNSALAEYADATKALAEVQVRIENDQGIARTATAAPAEGQESRPGQRLVATAPAIAVTRNAIGYCDGWRRNAPFRLADGTARRVYDSAEQLEACQAREYAQARVVRAETMLRSWLGLWRWVLDVDNRAKAAATAANLTGIMGTAMLPVLYGVLGAGAAVLLGISRKIETSTLNPRDSNLSLLQLALGAVVGSCIGLFIVDPGNDTALLGPVALSGSAVSFIAGFGVKAVFQALEGLITRLFNIASSSHDGSRA